MTEILLTNDDGYKSDGFYPLLKELCEEFNVTVVVPDSEKSWIGKSISTKQTLQVKQIKLKNKKIYICSGTPADCVQIGLYDFVKRRPKFVVSGINIGTNIGHGRILSSGTVGAAMEASIDGVMAISTSLHIPQEIKNKNDYFNEINYHIFASAAKITVKIIKIIMDKKFGKDLDLISINIPYGATVNSEFEITKPYRESYGKLFHKKKNKFIHIEPAVEYKNLQKDTDLKALSEGKVSITPISLELVSRDSFQKIKKVIKKEW